MILSVMAFRIIASEPRKLELQYGNNLDRKMRSYNTSGINFEAQLELNYKWVISKKITEDQILDFGLEFSAKWMFQAKRISSPNKENMRNWLKSNLSKLKDGAEREALAYLVYGENPKIGPNDFSEHSIRESSVVAFVVSNIRGNRFCHNEEDLRTALLAVKSAQRMPFSKFHTYGHECAYYFSCYFVRKDFKALRTAINFRYKAAEFDPNPNGIQENKDWCKPWEDMLKKKGF